MKKVIAYGMAVAVCLMGAGCSSTPTLFPADVTTKSSALEFGALQTKPDVFAGQVVQLAGRIVGVEPSEGGTLILASELPLEKHPIYGPAETSEPTTPFAVLYPGKVDPSVTWYGNKFVVVGLAKGEQAVTVNGIARREPYMVAKCMHVWKTGGYYGIADFPHMADGYYPLEHQTYCAQQ